MQDYLKVLWFSLVQYFSFVLTCITVLYYIYFCLPSWVLCCYWFVYFLAVLCHYYSTKGLSLNRAATSIHWQTMWLLVWNILPPLPSLILFQNFHLINRITCCCVTSSWYNTCAKVAQMMYLCMANIVHFLAKFKVRLMLNLWLITC